MENTYWFMLQIYYADTNIRKIKIIIIILIYNYIYIY